MYDAVRIVTLGKEDLMNRWKALGIALYCLFMLPSVMHISEIVPRAVPECFVLAHLTTISVLLYGRMFQKHLIDYLFITLSMLSLIPWINRFLGALIDT